MSRQRQSLLLRAILLAMIACMFFVFRTAHVSAESQPTPAAASARSVEPVKASTEPRISVTDLTKVVNDAGPLMYAILLCSVLLVAFFLERVRQFATTARDSQTVRQAVLAAVA